jgi:xylan 1,4-beta-xylosidase
MRILIFALVTLGFCSSFACAQDNRPQDRPSSTSSPSQPQPRTFCNPLNLDYGLIDYRGDSIHRHGADPVIVLYQNKYWLFSTWDRPGYRVSDDLVNWRYIPFGPEVELPEHGLYTAAAVTIIDDFLYFTEYGKETSRKSLYRTKDPASGKWEKVAPNLPAYPDPCLFLDPPTGQLFMYHGLERPIFGVELNRKTFLKIPGTPTQLMPAFDTKKDKLRDGWEVCTWDNSEKSPGMRGNKTFNPCREGAWMTFFDGRYYLQYASPGTTVPGYADGVLIGKTPLGPFEYSQHSPISRKASGFITSAGHSCLFQDRYGNWWRAVTMLIGVNERMERRIGLYPAGFDKEGIPYTRTELGDLPITLPTASRDHLKDDIHPGWWRLPLKVMAASSSLDGHRAADAGDENIRTWWSATKGGADREWIQLDLGAIRDVRALQINLAEQEVAQAVPFEDDTHRFVVESSEDGVAWKIAIDRSAATNASPHTYVEFDHPIRLQFLKVTNVQTPAGGKFAVSDVRAFGIAPGDPPAAVSDLSAKRDTADRRKVTLSWTPSDRATSYLIRYGITKDQMYQHDLVMNGKAKELKLYNLNGQPPYVFRIDALNASGRTMSEARADAP